MKSQKVQEFGIFNSTLFPVRLRVHTLAFKFCVKLFFLVAVHAILLLSVYNYGNSFFFFVVVHTVSVSLTMVSQLP